MLIILVTIVMLGAYFYRHQDDVIERSAIYALAMMALYWAIFFILPPAVMSTSIHIGRLYEFLPLLSLGMILFPDVHPQHPAGLIRSIGWGMWVLISVILITFKLLIW